MIPPRSPYGLIQEDIAPNEWLILVSCMMLNCTSRKQVESVFPQFVKQWSTPEAFLLADELDVVALIRPLGFANRRTKALRKMTEAFVKHEWTHVKELHGIGVYAARAWEIFCQGIVGDEPPQDHALVRYWQWRKHHGST